MNMPETANNTGDTSITRVSSTARSFSSASRPVSSPRPGAIRGTSFGASRNATTAKAAVASSTRLSTELARRQAASSPLRARTPAKVGMKAEASVAPARSWNTRSGSRNATQ